MTKNLAQKLSRLISSLDKLRKNKKNPFYNSNYTEINQILAQVKPQSAECGLTILQPIINDQVVTVIMDNDTGEMFPNFNETENMKGLSIKSEKPQDKGSEVTYYRRYGLQSLLALEAIDDDANSTVKRQPNNKRSMYNKTTYEDFDL